MASMEDTILQSAHYINSPNIANWTPTARITKLEFRPIGIHVDHTKRWGVPPNAWPNFRPKDWEGDLQYTLWIFIHLDGQWYASGVIQYWQDCDEQGGPISDIATNWFYDSRWGALLHHQPEIGAPVGFLVTAGDARNNGQMTVPERSNLVLMPMPGIGAKYENGGEDNPPPPPPPPPPPDPVPSDILSLLQDIRNEVITKSLAIEDGINHLIGEVVNMDRRLNDMETGLIALMQQVDRGADIKLFGATAHIAPTPKK